MALLSDREAFDQATANRMYEAAISRLYTEFGVYRDEGNTFVRFKVDTPTALLDIAYEGARLVQGKRGIRTQMRIEQCRNFKEWCRKRNIPFDDQVEVM